MKSNPRSVKTIRPGFFSLAINKQKDLEMALLTGKKAFIFGVLNEYSIGYHIAEKLHAEGCDLAFSPPPAEKIERRVVKAVEKFNPKFLAPCDVSKDEDLDSAFKK